MAKLSSTGITTKDLKQAREWQMAWNDWGYHATVKKIPGKGSVWLGGGDTYLVVMDEESQKRFEEDYKSGKFNELNEE